MKKLLSILIILLLLNSSGILFAQSPVANFMTTDTMGCQPYTVSFINTSTNSTHYLWSFGNGDTSVVAAPVYTFNNVGFQTITLIASDSASSDTLIRTAYIAVYNKPDASFLMSSDSGCISLCVNFTSTQVVPNTFSWNFGDTVISTSVNPNHCYDSVGNYVVRSIATNTFGCIDTAFATISTVDCTGISEFAEAGITTIFPNPFASVITLDCKNSDVLRIKITDIAGEELYKSEIRNPKSEIDLSGIAQGIYFIQVMTEKGIINKKIIKE